MDSQEIRKRFLAFFAKRGHAVIPSAPLVPEGDASTLFTTAGMQPLVPYLMGEKHPLGKRFVNIQKCVRTGDIDEVGDAVHLTFFEMLGNWSLGDYFKREAIEWSFELLTSAREGFGLDPARLYVTVFAGDENACRDDESALFWTSVGVPPNRIYYLGASDNWWSPGENGPCGPDTEMFYDVTADKLGDLSHDEFVAACDRRDAVELWNDVFMEYEKKDGTVIGKLAAQNVDTGAGLERLAAVLQKKWNVFDTDLFAPIMHAILQRAGNADVRAMRIVADHVRTAVFILADGVRPSNTDRGYVIRRIIRRAVRYADTLLMPPGSIGRIADEVVHSYADIYEELKLGHTMIVAEIESEERRFRATLADGLKAFEKLSGNVTGAAAFDLYQTYGFPIEMTTELAAERNSTVDIEGFEARLTEHQALSRTASAGMFKGGLADSSEETVKLHTAHHLLLAALQKVLGMQVKQRGSNITKDRLRIDFSFDRKLTDDEKNEVERQVNAWIAADLAVVRRDMPLAEAERIGAEMEFGQKYPDIVSVYMIKDKDGAAISKEFCGGPHVERTGALGAFRFQKEEASSAGVRRIKATLDTGVERV